MTAPPLSVDRAIGEQTSGSRGKSRGRRPLEETAGHRIARSGPGNRGLCTMTGPARQVSTLAAQTPARVADEPSDA